MRTDQSHPAPMPAEMAGARRATDVKAVLLAGRFVDLLRVGEGTAAEAVVDEALAAGISPEQVQTAIIAPAMVRIGELWEHGVLSVADEHLATSVSERALLRIFEAMTARGYPAASRPRVLLAAVEGQQHLLGLRMVADVLECAGHDVRYLGGDVSVDVLREAVTSWGPAVVGLSHGMAAGAAHLGDALAALHETMPEPRIVLGGRAIPLGLADAPYHRVGAGPHLVRAFETVLAEGPVPRTPHPAVMQMRATGSRGAPLHGAQSDTFAARLAGVAHEGMDVARQHIRQAAQFRRLAIQDPLTEVLNRRGFDERLDAWASGPHARGALLLLDVDGFKALNDTHGHSAGDQVLRAIGRAIRETVRPTDFAARLGGDEFAVALPGCDLEGAMRVAERIRAAILLEGSGPKASVSIGAAPFQRDTGAMLESADTALYAAKAAGRDRVMATAPASLRRVA